MNVAQLQAELAALEKNVQSFGALPETIARMTELRILIADATKAEIKAERAALTNSLKAQAVDAVQAAQAAQAQLDEANQAQAAEEMRAQAEQAWIRAGGTAFEFTQEWPIIRTGLLRQKTLEAVTETQGSILDKWLAARNNRAKPL